jgi:hypothetical protein
VGAAGKGAADAEAGKGVSSLVALKNTNTTGVIAPGAAKNGTNANKGKKFGF